MGEEYHKVLCIIGTGTIVHVWGCDEQNSSSPDSAQLMCPLVIQWNLLIRDTLVHRPLSLIRRLSLIGRFGIKHFYSINDV